MTTKVSPDTITAVQACSCGRHGRKLRGTLESLTVCVSCLEAIGRDQLQDSTSTVAHERDHKRRRSSMIPDSTSPSPNYPTSLISPIQVPEDISKEGFSQKKTRSWKQPLSNSLHQNRENENSPNTTSDDPCGICDGRWDRRSWKNKFRVNNSKDLWVQCEIKLCSLWYHHACVWALSSTAPETIVMMPSPSLDETVFICPNCITQRGEKCKIGISQALRTAVQTIEKLMKETILEEGSADEDSTTSVEDPATDNIRKDWDGTMNISRTGNYDFVEFELAREEKYNGMDGTLVKSLVRNLHQYIYDYDIEIRGIIECHSKSSDVQTKRPLEHWELVDANQGVVGGQQWFQMDKIIDEQSPTHAPITAALRTMLGTSDEKTLEIALSLKSLTFSQVHIGLVSWFVFDVLDNKIDLYGLANMKPMRVLMAAVKNAGDAKWSTDGGLLLREALLRTWYKPDFQRNLFGNTEDFSSKLESFLEPLTRARGTSQGLCREKRANIIEVAINLWAYLKALQGSLTMIQPAIGSLYNADFHEAYEQGGLQQLPNKKSKKKILWILCRGFQYEENSSVLKVKARVVIE